VMPESAIGIGQQHGQVGIANLNLLQIGQR
jgi:hypothetical protein